MAEDMVTLRRGRTPLLVSLPHVGTAIPGEFHDAFLPHALQTEDTDWHLERLYAPFLDLGFGVLAPRVNRYVIDLNRPPDDTPMYPGAANTELCPTHSFAGEPLYRDGAAPGPAEVARRRATYWQPYHDALAAELGRLRDEHGYALLWDGHSIHSRLPWLFDGTLPDLNLGTADGASCAPSLRAALAAVVAHVPDHTSIVDGRFKGGHITRRYGRPHEGVHAVQMEMTWRCYLAAEAPPFTYSDATAIRVQPVLRRLLATMLAWRPDGR